MYQSIDSIHTVVVHCSATIAGQWITAKDIDRMHKGRNPPFSMIGYHRVIRLDGSIEQGRPYTRRGAHVAGNNVNTIGVVMIGGLDKNRNPADTYNDAQYHALFAEIMNYKSIFPNLRGVCGHRDFSPDLNGDGLITPNEWIKVCPCFDVAAKLREWRIVI